MEKERERERYSKEDWRTKVIFNWEIKYLELLLFLVWISDFSKEEK